MRKIVVSGAAAVFVIAVSLRAAEEMPKMPPPEKQHEWLKQFVGEWDADVEMRMDPNKPPERSKGTESVRSLGGFWIVAENKGTFMDKLYTGVLTLGYDPQKKKYVGTWVDSVNSYLWKYEGTVDETGKILTLHTEGPCPMRPGKISKMKETIEFKSPDHKVFRSAVQNDDGSWTTGMVINYTRKK